MAVSARADPQVEGHVFASCTAPEEYLALLCYCNGAKQRERVLGDFFGKQATWADFDVSLAKSPPGNDGILGLDLVLPEITPVIPTPGRHFVGADGHRLNLGDGVRRPEAAAARAVIEGKFLSMRGRGNNLGVASAQAGRVLAAGGASKSPAIMQIAADVFGSDVLAADEPDAAALGAAFRAAHAALDDKKLADGAPPAYGAFLASHGAGPGALDVVARPKHAHVYDDALVARYLKLEADVQAGRL